MASPADDDGVGEDRRPGDDGRHVPRGGDGVGVQEHEHVGRRRPYPSVAGGGRPVAEVGLAEHRGPQRGWGCRRAADRAVVHHDDLDVAYIGELALEGGVEDRQLTGLLEVRDDDGHADVAPGAGRLDLVAHEVPAVVRHGEATGDCVGLDPRLVDHAVGLVSRL